VETKSERRGSGDGRRAPDQQGTLELIRSIAADTGTLVRKEVDLAKQEIREAISARVKAAIALGAAGVLGLLTLVFLGAAGAWALDGVLRPWAARLVVAGGFLLLAGGAALFGLGRMKRPPLAPEETKRTVKEDVQWARAQLKR
jgi:uncharacterized membrane protein YqjE